MIGSKLGSYEITAKLGEGGMGVVYRATDTRLDRQVAIKMLPAEFVEDHERLARFEREAKLLAQLNHPNIATIHGVEEAGGVRALVLELVDGPTLADRLEQGALPVDEALSVARQIAEALGEAHEKGIVHRDLKPQNVKVSGDGKVKVLDFGLAKALEPAGAPEAQSASRLAASPTLTARATMQGVILGTAAYMSPEQAKGIAADKRADIWAFGVVLWEMLTGRQLFTGDTATDTIAAVLRQDVDWTRLPGETPTAVRRTLARCLVRDPRKRLRDIGDVELESAAVEEPRPGTPSRPQPLWKILAPWILAAVAVLVVWFVRRPVPRAPEPVSRATIELPAGLRFPGRDRAIALSPDGKQLVAVLEESSQKRQLYLRSLAGLDLRALDGTDDASYPFWSPDGTAIGFFAHDELRRFDLPNGPVRPLGRALSGRGASWGEDGTIVFAAAENEERRGVTLHRISATTPKAPEPIGPGPDTGWSRLPLILPDGGVLFDHWKRDTQSSTSKLRSLTETGDEPLSGEDLSGEVQYVRPGYLAFHREDLLMVQPFDFRTRTLRGTAQVVAERANVDGIRGTGNYSFSTAALVYQRDAPEPLRQLTWFDREGRPLGTIGEPAQIGRIAASPDGTLALVMLPGGSDESRSWMVDLRSGFRSPFAQVWRVVWSPDGRRIAFQDRANDLVVAYADGASPSVISPQRTNEVWTPSGWSLDGSAVIVGWYRGVKGYDVAILAADGTGEPEVILDTPAQEAEAALSPDGKWLAYLSDESGQNQLYVVRYPDLGGRRALTGGGAEAFHWTGPDELLYRDLEDKVYSVSFRTGTTGLELEPPQPLFGGRPLPGPAEFVPAVDRFLVAPPVPGQETNSSLVLVTNWQSELKR